MKNYRETVEELIGSYREGYSLPASFYQDPALYQADLEAVFSREWIYAGHISQLPDVGCFFLMEFGDESIIIVKGKDSEIRAFANVCRHRGSRVCLKQSGKVNSFACPYHAWTYELNGQLRSKRAMPKSFDPKNYGLKAVKIEVFKGLIFINLDQQAAQLSKIFAPLEKSLDIYQLEKTKVACQKTFSVDANWKLALENFVECYHCAPAHPEYAQSHALNSPKDYQALRPAMLKRAKQLGYSIDSIGGTFTDGLDGVQCFYNRSAMYEGYVSGTKDGKPVAPLLGKIEDTGGGAADVSFGSLNYAVFYADHIVLYRFLPTALQNTDMEIIWLVNESAQEGHDYDLQDLTWLWTITTESDKEIILNNQKGVNSRFYEPGPLSIMENFISSLYQWYFLQLENPLKD